MLIEQQDKFSEEFKQIGKFQIELITIFNQNLPTFIE
jgi:hypothetical protein